MSKGHEEAINGMVCTEEGDSFGCHDTEGLFEFEESGSDETSTSHKSSSEELMVNSEEDKTDRIQHDSQRLGSYVPPFFLDEHIDAFFDQKNESKWGEEITINNDNDDIETDMQPGIHKVDQCDAQITENGIGTEKVESIPKNNIDKTQKVAENSRNKNTQELGAVDIPKRKTTKGTTAFSFEEKYAEKKRTQVANKNNDKGSQDELGKRNNGVGGSYGILPKSKAPENYRRGNSAGNAGLNY